MDEPVKLQFRPSLVIFVEEAGDDIQQHFSSGALLASLDEILRPAVGLLRVTSDQGGTIHAEPISAVQSLNGHVTSANAEEDEDEDIQDDERDPTLEEVITKMLRQVQLITNIDAIQDENYEIPDPRAQVYIVGHATARPMILRTVLHAVHQVLQERRFTPLVCYVLSHKLVKRSASIGPADATFTAPDDEELSDGSSKWTNRELANFCFHFEDWMVPTEGLAVTTEMSDYAAAAALFALTATGMTQVPAFQRELEISPTIQDYDHIGTLSTSFIMFPRAAVSAYCSGSLGAEVINRWIADIDTSRTNEAEQREQRLRAQADMDEIDRWLRDEVVRLGGGDSKGPTLAILTKKSNAQSQIEEGKHKRIHRQLYDRTRSIFSLFDHAEISGDETTIDARGRKQKRKVWTKIADKRANTATDAFHNWENIARDAWKMAGDKAKAQVKYYVDQLWPKDSNGIELAKVYIEEYDKRLSKVVERQRLLRGFHDTDYEKALRAFEELSDGEWLNDENQSSFIGDATLKAAAAKPVFGNAPAPDLSAPKKGGDKGGGLTPPPAGEKAIRHIPDFEDKIARQLGQRIAYMQLRVPGLFSILGVSIFFAAVLLFVLLSLVPSNLTNNSWLIGSASVMVLVVVSMNYLFRLKRQQIVKQAQEDLLRFYRRFYAHLCELEEDNLRLFVTGPLQRRVQEIRGRLEFLRDFISEIRAEFERDAQRVSNELFQGPAASRDIFVGNGERLYRRGRKNTLQEFNETVNGKRKSRPVVLWHRSTDDIKSALLRSFQNSSTSLIEMTNEQTRQHIFGFTQGIIDQYLTGDLVDIGRALDNQDMWKEVLRRATRSLHSTPVGIQGPKLWFICGRPQDLEKGRFFYQDGAIKVQTRNPEWLLVATFFQGGASASLDVEALFPRRTPADTIVEDDDQAEIDQDDTNNAHHSDQTGVDQDDANSDEVSAIFDSMRKKLTEGD